MRVAELFVTGFGFVPANVPVMGLCTFRNPIILVVGAEYFFLPSWEILSETITSRRGRNCTSPIFPAANGIRLRLCSAPINGNGSLIALFNHSFLVHSSSHFNSSFQFPPYIRRDRQLDGFSKLPYYSTKHSTVQQFLSVPARRNDPD